MEILASSTKCLKAHQQSSLPC